MEELESVLEQKLIDQLCQGSLNGLIALILEQKRTLGKFQIYS